MPPPSRPLSQSFNPTLVRLRPNEVVVDRFYRHIISIPRWFD
ncbi:MAG: hypothetical protein NZ572_08300 [Thermoflexus sp.]|nr:hypothetical protein [Thermoflexus sp.]